MKKWLLVFLIIGVAIMAFWPNLGTKYIQEKFSPGLGVDAYKNATDLLPGQATDMSNFTSRQYPALKTRLGHTPYLAPFNGGDINGIHVTPSGRVHILASATEWSVGSGVPWYWWDSTGNEWEQIAASTAIISPAFSMADWYDTASLSWHTYFVYQSGMGNQLRYWDGSALTAIAALDLDPQEGPVCSHLNRMFCPIVNANDANLQYSKLGDPHTWALPDGGIIMVGSNDRICSLLSMPDRLFIGTTAGIYALFGSDEETFALTTVTSSLGLPYRGNVSCVYGDTVYFTDNYDVYQYDANGIKNITRPSTINGVRGGFSESVGTARFGGIETDGKRLYVSSTIGNCVFDLDKRVWHIEETIRAVMARTNTNEILTYYTSYPYDIVNPYIRSPYLYKLNGSTNYDYHNGYNLFDDSGMAAVTDWVPVAGAEAMAGGFYQVTGDGSAATFGFRQATVKNCESGHLVYVQALVRVTDAACSALTLKVDGSTGGSLTADTQATPTANTWYTLSGIVTLDGTTTGVIRPYVTATYADAAAANTKVMQGDKMWCDDLSFTYGVGSEPTLAEYEAVLPATFSDTYRLIADTTQQTAISFEYESPAFQVRPTARKTLRGIYITADLTSALTFIVYTKKNSGSYSTIYTMPSVPGVQNITRIKVPIDEANNAEWVQIKITGTGQATILNIVLDWRIVERAS